MALTRSRRHPEKPFRRVLPADARFLFGFARRRGRHPLDKCFAFSNLPFGREKVPFPAREGDFGFPGLKCQVLKKIDCYGGQKKRRPEERYCPVASRRMM